MGVNRETNRAMDRATDRVVDPALDRGTDRRTPREPDAIRVEVGEFVLDGFRADPEHVSASFERELTRLIREHGVPLASHGPLSADLLSGLPPLPANLSARRLGQELARVVHEGLSGHGEVTR